MRFHDLNEISRSAKSTASYFSANVRRSSAPNRVERVTSISAASLPAAAEAQRNGAWFPFDHCVAVPHCAICGRQSPLDQLICRTSELIDGANTTEDAVSHEEQVGSGRCAGLPKPSGGAQTQPGGANHPRQKSVQGVNPPCPAFPTAVANSPSVQQPDRSRQTPCTSVGANALVTWLVINAMSNFGGPRPRTGD